MAMSEAGKKIWAAQIAKAKEQIGIATDNPDKTIFELDLDWEIKLDPEDFLDLINGKWDA